MIPKKRNTFLGEILIESGLLTSEGLQEGLERQKETKQLLGEVLVDLGYVTQEDIEWALSSQYQLPLVRPRDISVDRGCREIVPEPLAREFNLAPLFRTGDELSVVIDNPLRLESLSALDLLEGFDLNIALATASDVRDLIDELYGTVSLDPSDADRLPVESTRLEPEEVRGVLRDYTAGALLELVLRRAALHEATSIHFDPDKHRAEIKVRTGQVVHETFRVRLDWYRTVVKRVWKLTGGGGEAPSEIREGFGRIEVDGREISFSATAVGKAEGPTMILRLPVGAPTLPNLRDLRLPDGSVEKIALLLARGYGLWIVSGTPATVSSRILHALLQPMLSPGKRLLSVREDSRGYAKLPTFRSLEIFDRRGDDGIPEIPIDGEWDGIVLPSLFHREEIERALRFALSGRTVLATMEFPNPQSVLRFFLCHGINAALLASAVAGVMVQKEVRVLCRHCKAPVESSNPLRLPFAGDEGSAVPRYRPVGCEVCRFTGFESRDTLLDFWAMDAELRRVILGADPLLRLEGYGRSALQDECLERFKRGDTVLEDVLSVCEI
jgi:type IV pilus assembly protein PilB